VRVHSRHGDDLGIAHMPAPVEVEHHDHDDSAASLVAISSQESRPAVRSDA
jgi:hypothetical protein